LIYLNKIIIKKGTIIKMKKYFLIILLTIPNFVFSQNSKLEFEGVIKYKVSIILKNNEIDSNEAYKSFGRELSYFYKNGSFKWVSNNTDFEYEIFNIANPYFVVDKFKSNDTLYFDDVSKSTDTVNSIEKGEDKNILNIFCKSATFTVMMNRQYSITRRIFYPIDSLNYSNSYYAKFKSKGQDIVANYYKSIPLRLEMEPEGNYICVIFEAIEIKWTKLDNNIFQIDKKLPIKK
jgi:hypothetical protein